jgi:hypothetical protein
MRCGVFKRSIPGIAGDGLRSMIQTGPCDARGSGVPVTNHTRCCRLCFRRIWLAGAVQHGSDGPTLDRPALGVLASSDLLAHMWITVRRRRGRPRRKTFAAVFLVVGLVSFLSGESLAGAAPSRPFTQCPAVSQDPSCGTLIVIGPDGSLEAFNDPRVGPFNGFDNTLIGVQNDSAAPVKQVFIDAVPVGIFDFDGDGICSTETISPPSGCPFGPTGYEGPGVQFVDVGGVNRSFGTVEFVGEGLAPGTSTYFDLVWTDQLGCALGKCFRIEPPAMSVTLSGGGQAGHTIVVSKGTSVSAQATLSGPDAASAGGEIEYNVYSDHACSHRVTNAGTFSVSNGVGSPSNSVTLPPGSYFWQVAYYGDVENGAVLSGCEHVVETVERECTDAKGVGHDGPRGSEGLHEANHLDVSGRPHRLEIKKPGTRVQLQALSSAACNASDEFVGAGPARVNGVGGFQMSFSIQLTIGGVILTASVEKEGVAVLSLDHEKLSRPSKEIFSAG